MPLNYHDRLTNDLLGSLFCEVVPNFPTRKDSNPEALPRMTRSVNPLFLMPDRRSTKVSSYWPRRIGPWSSCLEIWIQNLIGDLSSAWSERAGASISIPSDLSLAELRCVLRLNERDKHGPFFTSYSLGVDSRCKTRLSGALFVGLLQVKAQSLIWMFPNELQALSASLLRRRWLRKPSLFSCALGVSAASMRPSHCLVSLEACGYKSKASENLASSKVELNRDLIV